MSVKVLDLKSEFFFQNKKIERFESDYLEGSMWKWFLVTSKKINK